MASGNGLYHGLVSQMEPEIEEIPHMPGNHFHFKPLSGKRLRRARGASAREYLEDVGAEAFKAFQPSEEERERIMKAAEKEKEGDPLSGYSDTLVLRYGLVGWDGPKFDDVPVGGDANDPDLAKDDLDEVTRRWAFERIAVLSKITTPEALSSGAGGASERKESAQLPEPSGAEA